MKVFALVVMLAPLAGACGDGRGSSGGPDGGQQGPDGGMQGPSRVTVVTGKPPALIVYREEATTAWKTPASPSTGTFELEVAGPYRVIVVCAGSDRDVFVAQLARTPDDERTIEQPCGSSAEFPFHVRGQMLQSGQVSFGDSGRGASAASWSFDLLAASGTFDFLAFFGDLTAGVDRFEIRRDITIAADLDLGAIDAAHEPLQALIPTRFTASNLAPGESLSSNVILESGHTFAELNRFVQPEPAWQMNLVPGTALRSTDTQGVELSAHSSSDTSDAPMQLRVRSILRRVRDGGSTAVTLMDPIGPTTFQSTADRLVATWTSLPAYDDLDVSRSSFSSDFSRFVFHDFLLSRAFIASTGATTATLDFTDVPGFRPEWGFDPALEQQFALDAIRGTLPEDHSLSEVSEDIPAPTPTGAPPRRVDLQPTMAQISAHRTRLQRLHRAARPSAR